MIETFEKWALHFVGPTSPMSRKKNYILVCTDYVTKWVEEKELFRATEKYVVDFIYEDIFTHFGVPLDIFTDQGTQFTSKLMKELTKIVTSFSPPQTLKLIGYIRNRKFIIVVDNGSTNKFIHCAFPKKSIVTSMPSIIFKS
jgi:hypothetical protein